MEPDQSMVAKRGLTNWQTFIPLDVKKSFKTQRGRILIIPAILAAIGHHFIAKNNFWGDTREDQKLETLFCCSDTM